MFTSTSAQGCLDGDIVAEKADAKNLVAKNVNHGNKCNDRMEMLI